MRDTLWILSGLLFIAGYIPYILAILRGTTKPAKASWIIWAILDTITLAGMYFADTVNGQILAVVLGVWIVAGLAIKYGTPGWTKLDKICLGGALAGILLWQTYNNPTLGIITSQCIVFLASIPTFVSSWKDPSHEDKLAWILYWASCICAVVALEHWTIADAMQPINYLVIVSVVMYLLFIRPRHQRKPLQNKTPI